VVKTNSFLRMTLLFWTAMVALLNTLLPTCLRRRVLPAHLKSIRAVDLLIIVIRKCLVAVIQN